MVVGLDGRADADDAAFVQVAQHVFADVGNISGDFFRSQLGVAGHHLEFFDMDGGEDVFLHRAFGNEDGVFVVVAAPGHEGHHQVFAQGQLAFVNAGAVRQNLPFFDLLAGVAGGLLPEAGVLVGLVELEQVVGAHAALLGVEIALVGNHDAVGVRILHQPVGRSHNAGAGVAATSTSMPVPTKGFSERSRGTA